MPGKTEEMHALICSVIFSLGLFQSSHTKHKTLCHTGGMVRRKTTMS